MLLLSASFSEMCYVNKRTVSLFVLSKRNKEQALSIVHKDLMKKKQQCTHLTRKEIKRNSKILRAKLLCTAYCTRKRTNIHSPPPIPPLLYVLRWLKPVQQTQSSPKDNTANVSTKKLLHLDWVSLHRTHECEILETTLNIKKAMWRQYKLTAQTGVWNKFHCSVHVLKAISWFTPFNYIQTLKIQISLGMLDMHFYSIYIFWKKPLNWVWHRRLGNIPN